MRFPVMWQPPAASYSPEPAQTYPNLTYRPSTATSRWLLDKWRHFQGHLRSRDVTSCYVTSTSCELQPCRNLNVPKSWLLGLLQPFPGDFWSNYVTSGHATFSVTWLPPASCSPVGAQMYPKLTYRPFTATSRWLSVKRPHFRSREVTWRHSPSRDCHLLRNTALKELKRSQKLTYKPCIATSRWLPVKWRNFQVTSGHMRSHNIISCHVDATSCKLQPCRSSNVYKLDL